MAKMARQGDDTTDQQTNEVNPRLLEILRCPVALKNSEANDDPGRLRLYRKCWLICDESGMKYPIRDGIPIMLVEEGEKYRHLAPEALPIPP